MRRLRFRSSAIAAAAMVVLTSRGIGAQAFAGRGDVARFVPALAAWEPTAVELRIGSASTIVVVREGPAGQLLVPVAAVLGLAEVRYEEIRGIGQARLEPDGTRVTFDPGRHRVRRGRGWHPATDESLVRIDDAILASPAVLELTLGVHIVHDRAGASLEVRDAGDLPLSRRLARAREREAARGRAATDVMSGIDIAPASFRAGVVLDYGVVHTRALAPHVSTASSTSVGAGLQVPAGPGVLLTHVRADGIATALDEASWVRTWPGRRRVSSLTVGTLLTGGPRSQVLDGIAVTNAALGSRGVVDLQSLQGMLAPGWSIDAWHGGQLMASAVEAGKPYDLRVPLTEGSTLVDLVAGGPNGQQRSWQRLFHTPAIFVPAKRLEYTVAAGACRPGGSLIAGPNASCRAAASADVRYGVSRSVVVRSGVDAVTAFEGGAKARPYAGLSSVVAGVSTIDLTVIAGRRPTGSARLVIEPSPSWILAANGERGALSSIVGSGTRPSASSSLRLFGRLSPSLMQRRLSLEASWIDMSTDRVALSHRRADVSFQLPRATMRGYVRREATRTPSSSSTAQDWTGVAGTLLPGRLFGSMWVRGGVEWQPTGVAQWNASLARPIGRWRFDVGMMQGVIGRPGLTVSLVSQGSRSQASTLMRSGAGLDGPQLAQALRGSLTWDAVGGAVIPSTEGGRGRSGVGGTVFLDLDEDGVLDEGEPGLPGVRVRVDHRVVQTDRRGRFLSWGMPTNSIVQLAVDSATLASPLWLAERPSIRTRTAAGAVVTADLAILAGGVIEGRIEAASKPEQWPKIRLVHLADGRESVLEAFPDGSFYAESLRPGAYDVRLEADSAFAPASTRVVVGAAHVARARGDTARGMPSLDAGSVHVVLPLKARVPGTS